MGDFLKRNKMTDTELLEHILLAAYKYDDKPHQLYSAIITATRNTRTPFGFGSIGEKEKKEIERLMDIEYKRDRKKQ